MEGNALRSPPCQMPDRIFTTREEPVGVRATPYHKPCGIRHILNALDPDEVESLEFLHLENEMEKLVVTVYESSRSNL
ncbi:hypothetical protein Bca52824_090032 [Brassica carinata]|uniref:Uncharacterized protein n=1 Tax=Brassica carinata TaxID=52824 RepID=A0A8X7NV54_BRACI|nr:hypothetical protein Bca52824_090032 [Brassica carinata]